MVAVASANTSLVEIMRRSELTLAQVAAHLDALDPEERVRQVSDLRGAKMQRRLWALAADGAPMTLDQLIAPGKSEGRWVGRNSMPMFTDVDKRVVRMDGAYIGWNAIKGINLWFAGPGYFTMLPAPGRPKEIVVDYTRLPTKAPEGWPPIVPNDKGTHTLVYGNLNDFCRRVSDGVFIGGAERKGKFLDIYFTVARL